MKNKVLVIDDRFGDYFDICNAITPVGYVPIPRFVDKEDNDFEELQFAFNANILYEYIFEQIQNHHQDLMAIICDYSMGSRYNGPKVIRRIRNQVGVLEDICKSIPIVSHTGISAKSLINIAKDAGANYYVHKPNKNGLIKTLDLIWSITSH